MRRKAHPLYLINMTKRIIILFFALSAAACSRTPSDLEQSLRLAGRNRKELVKVLDHYSTNPSDSLKLKAASFLIENMRWHYSYGGEYMDAYVRSIDSVFASSPFEVRLALYSLPEENPDLRQKLEIVPDVRQMSADYLIYNIDLSFKIWQESSWLRELHFDSFCEYLLPYRLGKEPLLHWKDSLPDNFRSRIKDAAQLGNASKDPYAMYKLLKDHLMKDVDYLHMQFSIPDSIIGEIKLDCHHTTEIYARIWRMCGIPTAVDLHPRSGDGNNRHAENVIIDERLLGAVPFGRDLSVAKAYRKTFSVNRSQILNPSKHYVPPDAKNHFLKDATNNYVRTHDIILKPQTGINKPEYLYLGVFSLGWEYVAHSRIKRGKALFQDVGVGIVYIPFYYVGNHQFFASDPFYLDTKGKMHYFIADISNTQTVMIDRKYKIADYKIWWSQLFINCRFEAANNAQFMNPQHIFTVTENTYWRKISVSVDSSIKARFYRFMNNNWPVDLAEIHFYDASGEEVKGKWIGDAATVNNPKLSNIYDGDRITYADIQSWVGVDFGSDVSLSKIEYTPRNDANGIYPGMVYELFFFYRDKWISIGKKTATGEFISFDNVPSGALLWLRNLTEGKEERIFVYENGKQRWL